MSIERKRQWIAVAAFGIILILGAWARLHDIERRTLDHPEVYTPGIDLPWHLSNPNPRFTLWQTLAGTFAGEPHPPGYYIVMLGWTKAFGSSILALRFPSLLFGAASILLIFLIAVQTESKLTGLLAAAMLAGNGLHLYYSQNSRMYVMGSFLGLLSTLLLISLVKNRLRRRGYAALYFLVTCAGLATHVYFWAIFATQSVWAAARSLRGMASLTSLLRLQMMVLIVASPLAAIAVFQSQAATRPSTQDPISGILRFLQFGSLFETTPLAFTSISLVMAASSVAFLTTLFLIAAYFLNRRNEEYSELQAPGDIGPPWVVTVSVAVVMSLCILAFAYMAKRLLPGRDISLVLAMSGLPILLVVADLLILRCWPRLQSTERTLRPGRRVSLPAFLAVVPVLIIATASLLNPMFIPRGTLLFVPYLLIVVGGGLAALIYRDKRWIALAALVAVLHVWSVVHFKSKPGSPDYKALASRWMPRIQDSDLIFVHGRGLEQDWRVAPIFYYLNADQYRYVGNDFSRAIQDHPQNRVWVLSFPSVPTDNRIKEALSGHRIDEEVDALNISATLYVPAAVLANVSDMSGGVLKKSECRGLQC